MLPSVAEKEKKDMAERVIKAALLGFGTVGGGVYKVLKMQQEEMVSKLGARVELKKILVRNIEKAAQKTDDPSLLTNNWKEIVDDPEIEIVIELIGGIEPARTYILEALEAGKNVVTANKDLIAADGHILLDTAAKNKKDFLHEAAVAGGIPIIRPIKQCLAGNHISEVMGIVNGTTNFILTKMSQNGMEFADALKLAQDLGYAESDPTADVEGLDAGRKVAILASAAFNSRVTFDDVYTEGITKITARVHPMLIDVNHPLASVNDAYNAVFVQGDAVQDAMFYGRGAGELPTASAVVGDVFDIVRNILHDCCGRIGCTCYKNLPIKHMNEISSKFFIRMFVEDRPGVLANIASVFGNSGVSLAQVIQRRKKDQYAEIVVITDEVKEKNLKDALAVAKGMSTVKEISGMIRVA